MPMRGGADGLVLTWDIDALAGRHGQLNVALEQAFASTLTVVAEGWPDLPVEVWARVRTGVDSEREPRWELQFCSFFAGTARSAEYKDVLTFFMKGLHGVLREAPEPAWGGIDPDWAPLWAIDDGRVLRLLATERTMEPSVFLVGHLNGDPSLFAAALEAWPLQGSDVPVELAEADTDWAF